jgi:IS30 family transposase
MSYHHLTSFERGQIEALRREGYGVRRIASAVGRAPSTISRELRRNSLPSGFDAATAQRRYAQRREECRPRRKLAHRPLWDYVFAMLPQGWTPETVAGKLPLAFANDGRMRISHETLYRALYADERMHCLIQSLPQARPKRRKRGQGKTRRGPSIPNRVGIAQRPAVVDARSRYGDWEGDTVVGANQKAFITTIVERKSLLLRARLVPSKQAAEVAHAVVQALLDMPTSWVKTITFDNGTEFAHHESMTTELHAAVYFADPYAAHQRGRNENTNGILRRFLPKGTDLTTISQPQLDHIVELINNRPRKSLGYKSANELFQESRVRVPVALRL